MPHKLTIITAFCPPEKGAAPYRILNTAKELQKQGFKVDIITTLANYPTGKLFKGYQWRLFKKETIEGILCRRYWLWPSNSNNPFLRIGSMISYCFSLLFTIPLLLIKRPQVVLVQTPPIVSGLVGVFIGKLIGAKVVLNVSDVWPLTATELGVMKKDSLSFKLFSRIEQLMYAFSDAFVGQSEETCTYLKKITDKPLFLYRNLTRSYFDGHRFLNTGTDDKKIVYAGLLGLAQGVFNICKEIDFKSLDIEFHIYGNGVEKKRIQEYITKHPDCNIFFKETVSKEEIQKKLLDFDATIIPLQTNIYGAFPSKITMAMASALPVFYSGDGEGAAVVQKYNLGYTSKAGNMNALSNNLEAFSKLNTNSILEMKQHIINVVKNNFDYDQQQLELFKFIKTKI